MRDIVILAHVPTDSVNVGFIPAAQRLGLSVVLLTDHAEAHRQYFSQAGLAAYPHEIVACDVFNPLAVIDAITCHEQIPAAIFSNSDHLQTSTAIAAEYFKLPRKDWHITYRAKNKAEMRVALKAQGLDMLWHAVVCDPAALARTLDGVPFPCIVKPREGVASQQVSLSRDRAELAVQCAAVWSIQPGQPLLLEEYIAGPLYTLETLGDGERLCVLGGFQVKLSPPPHFVELEASWGTGLSPEQEAGVIDIIRRFGIGFGACLTEFVMTGAGPRLIEINYRSIGDYREFLLQDTLGLPLFEIILGLYAGEPLPQLDIAPGAALIRYFTAQSAGRLTGAPEAFDRRADDIRITFKPLRALGETVNLTHSNKDYLGVLRGTGTDVQRLGLEMDRISSGLAWTIGA
ncbi:MAG TPA: siderophore biosynthesis protein [Thiobacillus sp.]|nr:MAG: siderophore biosynthesis protein [Hydrogenophilales bacterium 28-61-11]OYZ57797.1 MAG: siderophore biosynthesis protein [Hydrogenophilales bacterium 16-61-112]OZA48627.1 MAG: siderophore biosynthesis protein [Hydrogenophilales bacterium 17-61-76]HQT32029.1 siderophore biosynthesis protein [Thiobacillus sp.]HQT69895.1 siderophore biosynthesis protein [Thiobacillus sp.]